MTAWIREALQFSSTRSRLKGYVQWAARRSELAVGQTCGQSEKVRLVQDMRSKWPVALARRKRVRASTQKTLRASMRKHCASGLRAPQAFEIGALRHKAASCWEKRRPRCVLCQAKVFHELKAFSVHLLHKVFVLALHLPHCVPHWRLPETSCKGF